MARNSDIRCSFCNKTQDQVRKLIAGPSGVYICDECVDICADIIEEEYEDEEEIIDSDDINLLKPAEIMIHQPLGGAQGQATEIEIAAKHILRTKEKLNRMLAENCGKDIDVIAADTERDNWKTAEEAKEYGLIDHIFTTHGEIDKLK